MRNIKTFNESNDFEKKKEGYLKKFRELKASGKPFTLADTIRDDDGNLPEIVGQIKKPASEINRTSSSSAISALEPYHKLATKFNKGSITLAGGIKEITTSIGNYLGFFFKGNKIFYHDDSSAVLIEERGDIREISLYEIEDL
jgi:hypothetical protein